MYGYALQPTSIPKSFYKFIVKTGPIPEDVLSLNRTVVRGKGLIDLDLAKVVSIGENIKATPQAMSIIRQMENPVKLIPCELLHGRFDSCIGHTVGVFQKVFAQIVPVYLALNYAPMIILRFKSFIRQPWKMSKKSLVNAIRSSVFLGIFVTSYMSFCCGHRNVMKILPVGMRVEHKLFYFLFGILSSLSIFVEHKNRRSELALYVIPKGIEALYKVMYKRKWIFNVPHFEVLMFATGMGMIVSFFETESECLSTMVYRLLYRINETIKD